MTPLTLTKTRFTMAMECPRKLDYARDNRYFDSRSDDDFLKSLAEGGHQVGELARLMYPGGILVADGSGDDQARMTAELLTRPEVTLFEATIRHENLLVRCDVLVKRGSHVQLIEVKAKGYNPIDDVFVTVRAGEHPVLAKWRPYLYDVAYQAYVFGLAYPELQVTPYLMLLDKTVSVPFPGLNTMLPVKTADRRATVTVSPSLDVAQLDPPILRAIDVSREVALLHGCPIDVTGHEQTFSGFVGTVSRVLKNAASFPVTVSTACKKCQFYLEPADASPTTISGWAECMNQFTHAPVAIPRSETLFGLYRIHATRLAALLVSEPLALAAVGAGVFDAGAASTEKISLDERNRLQWAEAHDGVDEPVVLSGLNTAIAHWQWPLHFIDFETSRPAVPYHAHRTPYDQILFQFSHHVLGRDGRLEHRTQFIAATPGEESSIPVLRALQLALSVDDGTVIHWWTHERTVLKDIRRQVLLDKPADEAELVEFVNSMVGADGTKHGGRLADLGMLVSKTVFYPGTGGSSSLKKVLPAALRHSAALRRHYGGKTYGTVDMPSLNFKDWQWVVSGDGRVVDPYELLNPLFQDPELDRIVAEGEANEDGDSGDFVANGGGAIIAYDQLQQRDLPTVERERLTTQLLRYCELDTLAMVMVYQALTGHGISA